MSIIGQNICISPRYAVIGRRSHEDKTRINGWGFPETVTEFREWKFHDRQEAKTWAERQTKQKFACVVVDVRMGAKVYEN